LSAKAFLSSSVEETYSVSHAAAAVSAASVPKGAMIAKLGNSSTGNLKSSSKRAAGATSVTSGRLSLSSEGTLAVINPMVSLGSAGFVAKKPPAVVLEEGLGNLMLKSTVSVFVGTMKGNEDETAICDVIGPEAETPPVAEVDKDGGDVEEGVRIEDSVTEPLDEGIVEVVKETT
jgi:hypothetical protein